MRPSMYIVYSPNIHSRINTLMTLQTFWYLYHYNDWWRNDGMFLISEFFDLIIDLFECLENVEWSCETLEWWDQ